MKNNVYVKTILFLILFQIDFFPQGSWEAIKSPTEQCLRTVHFVDSLYGWVAGDSGIVFHSSDGGINWVNQDSKTNNNIYSLFFLNRELGWAAAWEVTNYPFGTELLRTTDGGENWIKPPQPEADIFISCILFNDSMNGWMGGRPHALLKTTDGGISWKQADIDSSAFAHFPVHDIKFYDSKFGYASGGVFEYAGVMWRTTNGGDYWYAIDPVSAPIDPIWQIHIYDSTNVIGVGGDFEFFGVGLIRTSDGGLNWTYEYISMNGVAFDIDFRTDYEAWSTLGFERKFIYSLDSGLSWNSIETADSSIIYDITFPDSLHGFGVGRDGAILKYKFPIINSSGSIKDFVSPDYKLQQNYPNPFNPVTKIKYSIEEDGFIKLAVYNLLGQEVAIIVNEHQNAGSYEFELNAEGFPSGIYIYILETFNFKASRKMMLLR